MTPGQVVEISDGTAIVKCADAAVALKYLTDAAGHNLSRQQLEKEFGLEPGTRL